MIKKLPATFRTKLMSDKETTYCFQFLFYESFSLQKKKYFDLSNRHFYRLDDCPINNNNNNDRLTAFDLGQPE